MTRILNTFSITMLIASTAIYARLGVAHMTWLCGGAFVLYSFCLFISALAKAEADNPYRGY